MEACMPKTRIDVAVSTHHHYVTDAQTQRYMPIASTHASMMHRTGKKLNKPRLFSTDTQDLRVPDCDHEE